MNGQLEDARLIKSIVPRNHHLELTLQEGANPQALLQRLVADRAIIHRFEMVEPLLNEIFIASVQRTNNIRRRLNENNLLTSVHTPYANHTANESFN